MEESLIILGIYLLVGLLLGILWWRDRVTNDGYSMEDDEEINTLESDYDKFLRCITFIFFCTLLWPIKLTLERFGL